MTKWYSLMWYPLIRLETSFWKPIQAPFQREKTAECTQTSGRVHNKNVGGYFYPLLYVMLHNLCKHVTAFHLIGSVASSVKQSGSKYWPFDATKWSRFFIFCLLKSLIKKRQSKKWSMEFPKSTKNLKRKRPKNLRKFKKWRNQGDLLWTERQNIPKYMERDQSKNKNGYQARDPSTRAGRKISQ